MSGVMHPVRFGRNHGFGSLEVYSIAIQMARVVSRKPEIPGKLSPVVVPQSWPRGSTLSPLRAEEANGPPWWSRRVHEGPYRGENFRNRSIMLGEALIQGSFELIQAMCHLA